MHNGVPRTAVKPFHGHHWGSRSNGKRKNWQRNKTLGQRFRENVRSLLGRSLVRNKTA
jgi:hypothetical protein